MRGGREVELAQVGEAGGGVEPGVWRLGRGGGGPGGEGGFFEALGVEG